jgi:hypothetical protein
MSDATQRPPYRTRFVVAFCVLAVLMVGAGVAAIVIGVTGGSASSGPWSSWKPNDSGLSGAQEIADHVSHTYKLPNGSQLVSVKARDLTIPQLVPLNGSAQVVDVPFQLVQVGPKGDDVKLLGGRGVLYSMCGLGQQCSIKSGKPTPQRLLVLRREALEIALYTFRYQSDIRSVVVLTPPARDGQNTGAMVFRRDTVNQLLDRPIGRTLGRRPPAIDALRPKDSAKLRALTQSHVFDYQVQSAPDGSAVMVLTQGG